MGGCEAVSVRSVGVLTVEGLHMLRAVEGAGEGSHAGLDGGGPGAGPPLVGPHRVLPVKEEGAVEGGEEGLGRV